MTGSSTVKLPFDSDQFFAVFARYNEAVWPAQAILVGLALVVVYFVWRPGPVGDRIISGILALLWAWMAVAYQFAFFRAINPAAVLFAAAFLAEAAALAAAGVVRGRLRFRGGANGSTLMACALMLYALVVYPLVGQAAGHSYPAAPTFGLPCPTTIFTLGVLVLAARLPKTLLVVPLAWAVVGAFAALQLGVVEDLGLPIAGIATALLVFVTPNGSSRRIPEGLTRPL